MSNPPGFPIWYELMTPDPDAAKSFYEDVVGWTVEAEPSGPMDYRMISDANGRVGGVMRLTPEMQRQGARPNWLVYFGVQNVDATTDRARELGAEIVVPPTEISDVGRFSLLSDLHGAPSYVMRPLGEEPPVFARGKPGRCGWNELCTPDAAAALGFFGALFGWENRETLNMGPRGGYHFLDCGPVRIGAAVRVDRRPARWNLYFNVRDIDAAVERVCANGGSIEHDPHDVPSGERIVQGTDPQRTPFCLVGPGSGRDAGRA